MSTKQQCARVAAKAKAVFANRQKQLSDKPKVASGTRNRVATEPVKAKQQTPVRSETGVKPPRRHRYTEAEWAEIRKKRNTNRNVRQTEGREHKGAQSDVSQGDWATMGRAGKTRRVNCTETGQIQTGLTETSRNKAGSTPVSQPNKRGWAQVAYQPLPHHKGRGSQKNSGAQLVLSGTRVASTSLFPAVRKVRGWVSRVSKVAGCSQHDAPAALDLAINDCNGRTGSEMSKAVIAAAANREIGVGMPVMSGTHNAFAPLLAGVTTENNFPSLAVKTKNVVSNPELEKVNFKKEEIVVDTKGMDEIDAAMAEIAAEDRNKIARKLTLSKSNQDKKSVTAKPVTKPTTPKGLKSAWTSKSDWVKKSEGKIVPRTVRFSEPKVFTFSEHDIASSDEEWTISPADRDYYDNMERAVHPGYPDGMTDWGEQTMWDEENGYQ
jgi:hypothetical protein